jgi:fatty acid synthase, animal type
MMHGAPIDKFPVCIEDIKFMKSTVLDEAKEIDLTITIQRGKKNVSNIKSKYIQYLKLITGSGEFEIVEKDEPICCGKIRRAEDNDYVYDTLEKNQSDEFFMDKKDFYKELRIRGYQYKGDFQLVQKVQNFTNSSKRFGEIEWTNSLISFIDCMVQTHITNTDSRELSLPISVRKVVVNFDKHNKMIENLESCKKIVDENGKEKIIFDIMIDDLMGVFRCGGIEVIKPEFHVVSRRKNINEPVLETYDFVSHFPTQILSAKNAAKFFVQLFIENSLAGKINIVEIDEDLEPLMTSMATAISEIPLITPTCYLLTKKSVEEIENVKVLDSNELSSVGRIDILMITGDDKINEFVNNINERGFLLIRNLKSIPTTPKNFKLIANLQLETENIFIFMKNSSSTFTGEIYEIPSTFGSFGWVEELKKLLETCEDLIIYSKDNFTGVLGFFKCLKKEFTEKTLRCFLIDDENAPNFDLTNSFFKNQLDLGLNVNIFKNGMWGSYRHLSFFQEIIEAPYSKHSFIHLFTKGDFSSISWVAGDLKTSDDNIIDIHYSSMNFRDVLVANQRISVDYEFENRTIFQYKIGFEFSGITRDGRRVAGVSGINGFSNAIKETAGNELTLINVPDSWSLEDAATFGTVYNTIYLAFFFRAKIEAGKSILIHAGSGALGQAAIHTAHSYGLKVYTTCGSKQKREFLLEEFPFLKDEDIGNSRDLSFEKMIMRRTNGRGVDYVLNSLSEDKMQASLRCVAENGTFLEVGKYDILVGNKIQLTHFLKEIKYVGIFLSNKFLKKNPDIKRDLNKKIEEDLRAGIIKPIRRTVFKANEIEKAFRYMASGKHIGKILLKIRESEDSKVTLPIQVKPRVFFDSEKVYIMPGGLGGMGMEIADWMIMRNCRKLVLSSSRGISNSYQSYRIR